MLTNSIPKLLQEANEVKQALAAIGAGLPPEISAAGMEARIVELETVISQLDAHNVEQSRAVVKGIFGADSSEYDMVGGTRASERSRPKKKDSGTK